MVATSEKEIEALFNSMGYQLKMGVLNASDYGVPQNRRRAVIIGKCGGEAPDLPVAKNISVTIWDAISDLAYLNYGEARKFRVIVMNHKVSIRKTSGRKYTTLQSCSHKAFALGVEPLGDALLTLEKKFCLKNT